jgi:hypothetical protein
LAAHRAAQPKPEDVKRQKALERAAARSAARKEKRQAAKVPFSGRLTRAARRAEYVALRAQRRKEACKALAAERFAKRKEARAAKQVAT